LGEPLCWRKPARLVESRVKVEVAQRAGSSPSLLHLEHARQAERSEERHRKASTLSSTSSGSLRVRSADTALVLAVLPERSFPLDFLPIHSEQVLPILASHLP